MFLRQFATVRRQQQPHLLNQVTVFTMEHLRGLTEFGLHWLYSALNGLVQHVLHDQKCLQFISKCMEAELENAENTEVKINC